MLRILAAYIAILLCTTSIVLPVAAQTEETIVTVIDTTVADADNEEEEAYEEIFTIVDSATFKKLSAKKLPVGYMDSLEKDPAFGYVKTGLKKRKATKDEEAESANSSDTGMGRDLRLLIVVILFLVALVYALRKNNIFLFRKKSTSLSHSTADTVDEDHIFSINYSQAINKAVQAQDYRLAARLHYLETLKILAAKNLIHFSEDKTNAHYVAEMRPHSLFQLFFNLTRNYEYIWYGLFDIDAARYHAIAQDFHHFKNNL